MKRRTLFTIVAVLTMCALACGLTGGGKSDDAGESGGGTGSADWPWDDVPLYPAADETSIADWEDLSVDMAFEEVTGRYFETPDGTEDVLTFYKAEMPRKGWTGGENAELVNDFSSVHWKSEAGEAVAIITISTDPDGNVRVMAIRADKPKD